MVNEDTLKNEEKKLNVTTYYSTVSYVFGFLYLEMENGTLRGPLFSLSVSLSARLPRLFSQEWMKVSNENTVKYLGVRSREAVKNSKF